MTLRCGREADDGHAVIVETAAPSVGTVGDGYFTGGDEAVVAGVADVVVAVAALGAMVPRGIAWDVEGADVAGCDCGDVDVAVLFQMWEWEELQA